MKSFQLRDSDRQSAGGGASEDFRGERRLNATHVSTTDPEARLYRKGKGKPAQLCYMGHVLMENRNGLAVGTHLTQANGTAEREAALTMVHEAALGAGATLGADKRRTMPGASGKRSETGMSFPTWRYVPTPAGAAQGSSRHRGTRPRSATVSGSRRSSGWVKTVAGQAQDEVPRARAGLPTVSISGSPLKI